MLGLLTDLILSTFYKLSGSGRASVMPRVRIKMDAGIFSLSSFLRSNVLFKQIPHKDTSLLNLFVAKWIPVIVIQ